MHRSSSCSGTAAKATRFVLDDVRRALRAGDARSWRVLRRDQMIVRLLRRRPRRSDPRRAIRPTPRRERYRNFLHGADDST
jgi:hypothetical protein